MHIYIVEQGQDLGVVHDGGEYQASDVSDLLGSIASTRRRI